MTMLNITKKQAGNKAQVQQITLKPHRNVFGHTIIAECRALPIREVLARPLRPLLWSLVNSDDSIRKTDKAARNLEKSGLPAETCPQPSACIIDGTSIVHKLKGDGKTFARLAHSAFQLALLQGTVSDRIDVVFDVCRKTSIKNAERCNRGSANRTEWKNIAPAHTFCSGRNV